MPLKITETLTELVLFLLFSGHTIGCSTMLSSTINYCTFVNVYCLGNESTVDSYCTAVPLNNVFGVGGYSGFIADEVMNNLLECCSASIRIF